MTGATVVDVGRPLDLTAVLSLLGDSEVRFAPEARERVAASHAIVREHAYGGGDRAVYGVNTGFGALADVRIPLDRLEDLQRNLVRSHCCGVGAPLPEAIVRIMLLLRAQVLALGHSGVRPELVDALVGMIKAGVHPIVPSRGSVGASGDLAPLAHLALVLIGEGDAIFDEEVVSGADALAAAGLEPFKLGPKEGLALVNGTQAMTAVGIVVWARAERVVRYADLVGAWSLEALLGSARAFDARIHALRPHPGQVRSAARLRLLLDDSGIVESHADCGKVQDPYSLRCMPQVHGAVADIVDRTGEVLEREVNSVTDNPLVFADDGDVLSGGNFHGAPVAFALDHLKTALCSLMGISERRVEQLVNPHLSSGLPAFLAGDSGVDSGFMIAQVAAASLVTEAKILSHPASADSIPSSANREDHVSMGMTAALGALQVVEMAERVLAIESLCASQGLDLRAPRHPGPILRRVQEAFRARVPFVEHDRPLSPLIAAATDFVRSDDWAFDDPIDESERA